VANTSAKLQNVVADTTEKKMEAAPGFEPGMTRRAKRVAKKQEYRRPRFERERLLKGLGKLEAEKKMEAAPGFEPGMTILQTVALATWLCRLCSSCRQDRQFYQTGASPCKVPEGTLLA
jgi:hypothetical protein